MIMLKNYILTALRNLKRQKVFSLINIFGMAAGMAGFLLFAQIAGVKLQADKFHKNAENIYSIVQVVQAKNKSEEHRAFTSAPLADALGREFPEIKAAVRVYSPGKVTLTRNQDAFYEENLLFVDPAFLSVFTFSMVSGDPRTALSEPYSLVISEAAAIKYFGDADPVGQSLIFQKDIPLQVTGVTKNIPRTSSLKFDFLVSMDTLRAFSGILDDWSSRRMAAFLWVSAQFDRKECEAQLPTFMARHVGDTPDSPRRMYLSPLLDFRLKSEHIISLMGSSSPAGVYVMLAIGALLLLVVSLNFVNLSTVRSMHRAKEIGIRKVAGAGKAQLVRQFLGESVLLSFLAMPLAVVLYEMIHPAFYAYMGDFALAPFISQVSNSIWNYPYLLKYLAGAALITGIFSGLYPAFFLSGFRPLYVLRRDYQPGWKKKRGSKAMIGFQFTLSVIFIAAAALVKFQTSRIFAADFGYTRDKVVVVQLDGDSQNKLDVLKTEIARHPEVVHVSGAANLPMVWASPQPVRSPQDSEEDAVVMDVYGVDYDFIETLELRITAGRSFSANMGDGNSIILNQAAKEQLDWENPIGKKLTAGAKTGTVVGITENFIFSDIGFEIPPAVLYLDPDNLGVLLVKYSSEQGFPGLREYMKTQWVRLLPGRPFECSAFTDYFDRIFGFLNKISGFMNMIGLTVILFSCLGLAGLTTFLTERRTKEIGIRKVLGASAGNLIWKMTREFLLIVAAANVIALGLVTFGWSKALQTGLLFITPINAGTYAAASGISLSAAFLAVIFHTSKAAAANPADSLRTE
jgi:putative ABC transport system permease protein